MTPPLTALLGLLSLAPAVVLSATLPRQSTTAPVCTAGASIPKMYTFGNLNVTYAASGNILQSQSTASWTFTNTATNVTENLSCTLRGGYTCQINGTPKHPDVTVWLQLNLIALFSFLDARACDGKTASITGAAEMPFTCPDTPIELGQTCLGDVPSVEAGGYVDLGGEP